MGLTHTVAPSSLTHSVLSLLLLTLAALARFSNSPCLVELDTGHSRQGWWVIRAHVGCSTSSGENTVCTTSLVHGVDTDKVEAIVRTRFAVASLPIGFERIPLQ